MTKVGMPIFFFAVNCTDVFYAKATGCRRLGIAVRRPHGRDISSADLLPLFADSKVC
jgi:hypothetical protein